MIKFIWWVALCLGWNAAAGQATLQLAANDGAATLTITVEDDLQFPQDTMILSMYEYGVFDGQYHYPQTARQLGARLKGGRCVFSIPLAEAHSYFSLMTFPRRELEAGVSVLLLHYLVSRGDSIQLYLSRAQQAPIMPHGLKMQFTGRGADKFQCQRDMEMARYFSTGGGSVIENRQYQPGNLFMKMADTSLQVLDQYKAQLSPSIYQILYTDQLASSIQQVLGTYQIMWRRASPSDKSWMNNLYPQLPTLSLPFGDSILAFSRAYGTAVGTRIVLEQLMKGDGTKVDYYKAFDVLIHEVASLLGEKLQLDFINRYASVIPRVDSLTRMALKTLRYVPYRNTLALYLRFQAGQPAYPFNLPDVNGVRRTMQSLRGKVVFIDFWFTGCSPCRILYQKHLKAVKQDYQADTNVVFVSISVDRDRTSWHRSVLSGAYTDSASLNLYTDGKATDHEIIRYYGIQGYPTCLVFDRQGQLAPLLSMNQLNNAEGIRRAVTGALQRGRIPISGKD
jgi:thiol-disulfide isomerase/thioredoxin